MADERLRQLQRDPGADVAARVRLLRERLRRGELSTARVQLAAYLGDPVAQAVAPEGRQLRIGAEDVRLAGPVFETAWAQPILRLGGMEALQRAMVALLRASALWSPADPSDPMHRTLDAIERWLVGPERHDLDGFRRRRGLDAALARRAAEVVIGLGRDALTAPGPAVNTVHALTAFAYPHQPADGAAAIARELVPWALGEGDPIAARLQT